MKTSRQVTCGHASRKHAAKGMCNACYSKSRRTPVMTEDFHAKWDAKNTDADIDRMIALSRIMKPLGRKRKEA